MQRLANDKGRETERVIGFKEPEAINPYCYSVRVYLKFGTPYFLYYELSECGFHYPEYFTPRRLIIVSGNNLINL